MTTSTFTIGKKTPKGTNPNPMRVATKHKRVAYGKELQAKAATRHARRAARMAKSTQGLLR
jgi:hypothetical protein